MRALTIKNPWAGLIALGIKDIENRTWPTQYRGKIYIHTSKVPDRRAALTKNQELEVLAAHRKKTFSLEFPDSQIIGEVEIVDCIRNSKSVWAEPGAWHWVLARPILYDKPAPCKGALSFWTPTIEVLNFINQANGTGQL